MAQRKLSPEQVREVHKLRQQGLTFAQIGARYGCSWITVYRVTPGAGHGVRPGRTKNEVRTWHPGPGRLGPDEREEIGRGLVVGETFSAIAARLGRSVSTISREVEANGGRRHYRGVRAHIRAYERARRPKVAKLDDPDLCELVSEWLTRVLVARADRPAVAPRVPRRSDEVGEPRDDLPIALRPGPW